MISFPNPLLITCRPLVGSKITCYPEKKPSFFGHLVIDKLKHQMQREMVQLLTLSLSLSHTHNTHTKRWTPRSWACKTLTKVVFSVCFLLFIWFCGGFISQKEAVSTSHCSQPNTIEYEMAMEWCLLQERSDCAWKKLYEVLNWIFLQFYQCINFAFANILLYFLCCSLTGYFVFLQQQGEALRKLQSSLKFKWKY